MPLLDYDEMKTIWKEALQKAEPTMKTPEALKFRAAMDKWLADPANKGKVYDFPAE